MNMESPSKPTWNVADHREVITRPEAIKPTVLVPGVTLCPLVGAHNAAQGLFTGLITVAPGASYPLYAREFTEALVLLEGEAAVDVADRRYRLGLLDAINIPARLPRRAMNLSAKRPAVVHASMAAAYPEQTWVNGRFTPQEQPPGATGFEGAERLCHNEPAARFELAPRTGFQEFFGAALGAHGICGGYGMFEPGARLPCHRHEFDESITIVHGTATCVVEGRRHELSGNATALVPRGRCHYFINLTLEPMAMIWVYAGEQPDRIVMDETHCHPERSKEASGSRSDKARKPA
jgi:mannose-6-phosphate isomerase-like protein (cupin superfamily)